MSAEEELNEDQEGVFKIPAANFINDVEEYLAGPAIFDDHSLKRTLSESQPLNFGPVAS